MAKVRVSILVLMDVAFEFLNCNIFYIIRHVFQSLFLWMLLLNLVCSQ